VYMYVCVCVCVCVCSVDSKEYDEVRAMSCIVVSADEVVSNCYDSKYIILHAYIIIASNNNDN